LTDTADTYLLLRAFVDELVRCGLAGACTSPGSRSTPLVLSLVRDGRLPCWSHVDERVAGFFALGVAKATGRPAAVTCTSGTAAAHYLPAVIEAREARVPLIVLTADRPPELREVGAGQAIDQLKLYGDHAKWFFDVGTHDGSPERLRWMRALACRAMWTALGDRPGPVHLNFALREPLVLDAPLPAEEPGGGGRPDGRPWLVRRGASPRVPAADAAEAMSSALALLVGPAERPVIVAGRDERGDPAGVAAFAAAAGVPLLADPLSGARRGRAAVAHYDALLRDEAFAAAHAPDLVVRTGDLPTSKPLRGWLAGLDGARQVALDPEGAWQDPAAVVADAFAFGVESALAAAPASPAPPPAAGWLEAWRAADDAAARAIAATLPADAPSEPAVAAALADLPAGTTVFTASSMPVRDVETFWPGRDAPPRVLAHRGANGIDGTVAAAFGAAAAGGPVVLHIGDVALVHDLGALLSASRLGLAVAIVLVDNGGGGIFDFLAVATQTDVFEDHVATPTGLDFERAAALFGLGYAAPGTMAEVRSALDAALAAGRTTLVHVRTDRGENLALHRRVWPAVAAAVRAAR
jgi:2-succinyl-5-enolpyruvyl-6-hydroxy-3-cyclohexene-1-carboxylate synthase